MIAVSFQTGIFDLDKKCLIEANKGYATTTGSDLALIGGDPLLEDEFYVWKSLDDAIDMYVDQAIRGGGNIVFNERQIGGRQLIKINIPALNQRVNVIFEEVE